MDELRHGVAPDELQKAFWLAYGKTRKYVEEIILELGD
jgi:hypothetical protein